MIVHGNGLNYKFWVHDGSGVPATISIENIDVDDDATGDFTLLIKHPDGYAGALDWNAADLTYAGGTSTTIGAKIVDHLGEYEKQVHIDRLDGSLEVGGWVWDVSIAEWGGWPILRAAKGGGAICSRGAIALRRCAAEAIEQRSPVASALHRRRGDAIRRPF